MKAIKNISIEQALKEGNSSANQNIKSKFVSIHVHANVNQMVEFILSADNSKAPFTFDDITNFYSYPELVQTHSNFEGGTEDQKDNEIERLKDLQSDLFDELEDNNYNEEKRFEIEEKRTQIQDDITGLENLETDCQDVFEWWLVSDFLATKLKEMGHPIIKDENIWGRCTTGQAILLDYAITKICAEMGILEGQANSWATNSK